MCVQANFKVHYYNTWNGNNTKLPKIKTDLQRKSVFFDRFKTFNDLPTELKECKSEDIFKRL